MIKNVLKKLIDRGFDVLWYTDNIDSSLKIQMSKFDGYQWHKKERQFSYNDMWGCSSFEFTLAIILKQIANELDMEINIFNRTNSCLQNANA